MLEIKPINPSIVLLVADTQQEIASAVIRFQEYYESPIPEIRNNIFTLGQLKSLYATSSRGRAGGFTYISTNTFKGDWNGFNFPGYVFEPFVQGLFDPLTQAEQDLVELFRYRTDKFYVIGVHKEKGEDWALAHEIAHATYYIDEEYQKAVNTELAKYDLTAVKEMLMDWGYCEEVLDDESHAYIGCDYDRLLEEKQEDIIKYNIDMKSLKPLSEALKALYDKHTEGNERK